MRRHLVLVVIAGCGGSGDDGPNPLPAPACESAGGSTTVAMPAQVYTLADRYQEAWLASPAVADVDGDGTREIIVPRHELLLVWHTDGSIAWRASLPGRIWASPVVADLLPSSPGLEVAVASREQIAAVDAHGNPLPGFPFSWRDELRSLAAGDIDGDGALELVAIRANGSIVPGFPPNTTGAAGCDDACYVTGGYDQNIALGDVDGDRPRMRSHSSTPETIGARLGARKATRISHRATPSRAGSGATYEMTRVAPSRP